MTSNEDTVPCWPLPRLTNDHNLPKTSTQGTPRYIASIKWRDILTEISLLEIQGMINSIVEIFNVRICRKAGLCWLFRFIFTKIFFKKAKQSTLESWINVLHSYLFLKLFSLQHLLIQDNTLIRFQQNFLATHFKVLLNLFSAWNYMKNITHLGKSEKIKREEGSLGHQLA